MRALLKGSRVVLQKPKMSADKNILLLLLFFLISIKTTKKKNNLPKMIFHQIALILTKNYIFYDYFQQLRLIDF